MNTKSKMLLGLAITASLAMIAGAAQAAPAAKRTQTCETVSAVAAGFGKANVTGFANGNLDNAISAAKDRLAGNGAKGFTVSKRAVKCEDYINFGGSIGREHKCTATAVLCGRS
jgi:hypothetical protein